MGWQISAVHRQTILKKGVVYQRYIEKKKKPAGKTKKQKLVAASAAAAAAAASVMPAKGIVPDSMPKYVGDVSAVVDGNALVRSKVVSGVSAMQIARSAMKTALQNNPKRVLISFDTNNNHSLMRHEVHSKRQKRVSMPPEHRHQFLKKLKCNNMEALEQLNVAHLPFLKSSALDWQVAFSFSDLKKWAWTVFEAALRHIAVEMVALRKEKAPEVVLYCSDSQTEHHISTSTVACTTNTAYRAQEADLDAYSRAVLQPEHTMLHTIDTDLVMLPFAQATLDPAKSMWICLKNEAYDFEKIVYALTDGTVAGRLNVAFWMMANGTDYNDSLTTVGYYTRDIVAILMDNPSKPFTRVSATTYTFSMADALSALPAKKCAKKCVPLNVHALLKRIAYSVQYYGRWWDPETHPTGPDLPDCSTVDPDYTLTLKKA